MEGDPLDNLAAADKHLGRRVPLPHATLPLAGWIQIVDAGENAVEVQWNLDDSREGAPGRLALYAGTGPPAERGLPEAHPHQGYMYRMAGLEQAQESLRPVHELGWTESGLHLRLTAQGPWNLDDLVAIADTVRP